MSTLYDLFKVQENATFEQIRMAYESIIKKSQTLPESEKLTEQIRRVKIAYGILSNPEKRKKYDLDLANKRANDLLDSIQVKNDEKKLELEDEELNPTINQQKIRQTIDNQINKMIKIQEEKKADFDKKEQEEKLKQKNQKREERRNRRQERKQKQLQREMQMQAYGDYLQRQGYRVKYPWTWLRVKRLLLSIMVTVLIMIVLWHIPFVQKKLMDLYENNFIIHALVNVIISIVQSIGKGIRNIIT